MPETLKIKGVVDADAHVDETDETWDYMSADEKRYYRPITVDPGAVGQVAVKGDVRPQRFWLVDGRTGLRRWREDERTGTTRETRELVDVPARLRHMDEMGVDVQVIYPTYLLAPPSSNPEIELAIYRSYNRWLADKTAASNGRLRWVVVPPMLSMDKTIEELRYGKEHGAVGVFKRAVDYGKAISDPYFYPLYEEAERLGLPICTHTGGDNGGAGNMSRPQVGVFTSLVTRNVPERFPKLRFGVVEAMASWISYVIADQRAKNAYSGSQKRYSENPMSEPEEDFMRANRFYITCQTSEDIPYLVRTGCEDSLIVGTDYTHGDQASVLDALNYIEDLGEQEEITMDQARKILVDNPRAFYGL